MIINIFVYPWRKNGSQRQPIVVVFFCFEWQQQMQTVSFTAAGYVMSADFTYLTKFCILACLRALNNADVNLAVNLCQVACCLFESIEWWHYNAELHRPVKWMYAGLQGTAVPLFCQLVNISKGALISIGSTRRPSKHEKLSCYECLLVP